MAPSADRANRPVLVTGCSSGIGYCAAHVLHARGYPVYAGARQSADVERLTREGLHGVRLDVADSTSIQMSLDTVLEHTSGELYAVFNNAGYGQPGAVEDLTRDALRQQFETNLLGAIELTNRIIPIMRRQGYGRIVFNSSILGFITLAYRGAYNASKHAMEGITDTLRLELTGSGIGVSLIEPGPIESRFGTNALAALERHIDIPNSVHRARYQAAQRRLQATGEATPFTLPPEAVADKLVHALESKHPRPHYPVTFPTYLFAALKRLLPVRALDWMLLKVSHRESR